jgi:cysteine desulfurase / selenocysteine lyase
MSLSNRIYFDNAATSFPKPPEVLAAMVDYATNIGASAGRGAYAEAQQSARVLRLCRERLNTLFHGENADHFIFTLNCTDALNLAIRGVLNPGDHAITTWMDHNSVLRPYHALAELGVTLTHVKVDPVTCVADPEDVRRAITPKTKLIACVHGSNVTGTLQHIREIGKIAREAGVLFLVDGAQSVGHVPIDVQADCIDLLAAPGHKGLMGPLGTGFLYLRPGVEKRVRPLRWGGTGSVSELAVQPEFMPDKFEAGSHNAIGLAGLSAGLEWVLERGVESLWRHDRALCKTFMEAVDLCEGLRYFGPQGIKDRMGVFSVRIDGVEPLALAQRLEKEFGILTRPGLHCAPLAHQTIGTSPSDVGEGLAAGTTRLSFGPFLSPGEVQFAADALCSIALEKPVAARG